MDENSPLELLLVLLDVLAAELGELGEDVLADGDELLVDGLAAVDGVVQRLPTRQHSRQLLRRRHPLKLNWQTILRCET